MSKELKQYIDRNWDKCIYKKMKDDGTLIGLPYPYTVPAVGHFDEIYYWDTYFTNVGLMIVGRHDTAKNNVDNMLYLVNKFGYMPNGNRTWFLGRSQPPYLSIMVKDIYEYYNDKVWLFGAYEALKTEYKFWTEKRTAKIGLAHFDDDFDRSELENLTETFKKRVEKPEGLTDEEYVRHLSAICESGWDMTTRWENDAYNYATVGLNSLLYMLEKNMAYFKNELNIKDDYDWEKLAKKRKELMHKYLEIENGLLMDYNFERDTHTKLLSAAIFYPMFANLVDEEHAKAIVDNLYRLEGEYGIFTCEKCEYNGGVQWDYPNGWACMQYIAMKGLDNYGYKAEALRVAEKYVSATDKIFKETNNLWEKYNALEGSINVKDEHSFDMPSMMGWTAGIYLASDKYLLDNKYKFEKN